MAIARSQRFKASLIASALHPLLAALGPTLRWSVSGYEHHDAIIRSGRQPIFAFWHGRILAGTFFWRGRGIVVMTSENFDGEWIARIIRRFGFEPARGSTSRGGVKALVQLKREMAAGRAAAFTIDGPRGPARVAQAGAVWLAGATGNPILPFHAEADRCWTLGSWDAAQIPKPFSRVAIAIGAPLDVPATGEATIEERRGELERRLGGLEREAMAMLRRVGPGPSNA